jgi:hypothetical protein
VVGDYLHAELAMIDENLCRVELSPSDRARQTARRKAIYLELHPETADHVAGAHGSMQHRATRPPTWRPRSARIRTTDRIRRPMSSYVDMILHRARVGGGNLAGNQLSSMTPEISAEPAMMRSACAWRWNAARRVPNYLSPSGSVGEVMEMFSVLTATP